MPDVSGSTSEGQTVVYKERMWWGTKVLATVTATSLSLSAFAFGYSEVLETISNEKMLEDAYSFATNEKNIGSIGSYEITVSNDAVTFKQEPRSSEEDCLLGWGDIDTRCHIP